MRFEVKTFSLLRGIEKRHWDVTSEDEARRRAIREGVDLIDISPAGKAHTPFKRGYSVKGFAQELVALIEAGFSLVEALETLRAKEDKDSTLGVVDGLLGKLRSGVPFSMALEAYPETFSALFIESVRASEQTGDVAPTLRRYIDYENRLDQVKAHVIAASVYPLLLIVAGLFVTAFMLLYVVPRLAGAFENVRGQAPLLSRLLFGWGEWANQHMPATLISIGLLLGFAGRLAFNGTLQRRLVSMLKLSPRLWEHLRTYHLARFYRTVGMLLAGGTPLLRALDMATGILPEHMRPALKDAKLRIASGEPLSQAFEATGLTTVVALRMFRVGERTGALDDAMERIAAFHDERLEQWIKRFMKLFEPALMLVIGALIGGIVLLMYMPIFQLAGSVH